MKFLEAKRVLASFEGGEPLRFLLAMSGQPEPLDLFARAAAAEMGFDADYRTLPFNTLAQALRSPPREDEMEIFLLFPWDLSAAADWRSGLPGVQVRPEELKASVRETVELLGRRPRAELVYVDAPIPPLFIDRDSVSGLRLEMRAAVTALGATTFDAEAFSLQSFLAHGSPLASSMLGEVARAVVECAIRSHEPCKVVVTDFDNTMWHGIVGEDGVDGLAFGPEGLGYPHFIYQTFLRHLKASGVLIAGVTKNDADLARAPLETADSVLKPDDFVALLASYNPKSVQIAQLAEQLNLGLESFVFVDDNPVEIAEVTEALPTLRAFHFPASVSGLPALVSELADLFARRELTAEDRDRTAMYRRMLAGMVPKDADGADVTRFLADLQMRLTIRERTLGDRDRAIQLINKTNQFNLNGVRRSAAEVDAILERGGRLFTASLSDRHGSHGEILACLVDAGGTIRSLVMSCRVLQRRVEHVFLAWLSERYSERLLLEHVETERNEPLKRFLGDVGFRGEAPHLELDTERFLQAHGGHVDLFELLEEVT